MTQLRRLVGFLTLVILSSACSFSLAADVTPPPGYQSSFQVNEEAISELLYPLVPPDQVVGEKIFQEECSPCHGQTGKGDGSISTSLPVPVAALGDQAVTRQATPGEWFRVVSQGNLERSMPSFKLLTDRQRWDVVAYALILDVTGQDLSHGSQLFEENCASCHGLRGDGKSSVSANLDVPNFTAQEYMARKSTADFYEVITNGSGIEMPSFIDRISEVERWEVADFIRSLSFTTTVSRESVSSVYLLPQSNSILQDGSATTVPEIAITQKLGDIKGKVVNTSGHELPPGLEITLHAFDQIQAIFTTSTILKENGAYLFYGINMPVGRTFMTSVVFDGVEYYSDVVVVEENQNTLELPLEVHGTTTDSSVLLVERLHYFFELLPGEYSQTDDRTLRVVELYVISNPGSKTLIAPQSDQPVVLFHLPPGASNLEFQDGNLNERYLRTSDGFGDTMPVLPGIGNYQVLFSYTLPYSGKLNLSWPVKLPIKALVILAPGTGIAIEGNGIQDAGVRDIQGVQYQVYEGNSFSPGEELNLMINSQPMSKGLALLPDSGSNLLIGLAALAMSSAFVVVWSFRQNHSQKPRTDSIKDRPIKPATLNPGTIMDAILALDDLYRGGSLPEDAYLQRRAELKTRLRDVLGGLDAGK